MLLNEGKMGRTTEAQKTPWSSGGWVWTWQVTTLTPLSDASRVSQESIAIETTHTFSVGHVSEWSLVQAVAAEHSKTGNNALCMKPAELLVSDIRLIFPKEETIFARLYHCRYPQNQPLGMCGLNWQCKQRCVQSFPKLNMFLFWLLPPTKDIQMCANNLEVSVQLTSTCRFLLSLPERKMKCLYTTRKDTHWNKTMRWQHRAHFLKAVLNSASVSASSATWRESDWRTIWCELSLTLSKNMTRSMASLKDAAVWSFVPNRWYSCVHDTSDVVPTQLTETTRDELSLKVQWASVDIERWVAVETNNPDLWLCIPPRCPRWREASTRRSGSSRGAARSAPSAYTKKKRAQKMQTLHRYSCDFEEIRSTELKFHWRVLGSFALWDWAGSCRQDRTRPTTHLTRAQEEQRGDDDPDHTEGEHHVVPETEPSCREHTTLMKL